MRRSFPVCVAAGGLVLATASAASAGSPGLNGKLIYTSSAYGTTVSDADPLTNDAAPVAPASGFNPAWSPDGTHFVIEKGEDLWVYAADGTHGRRITHSIAFDETPAWSPDSTRIVFGRATNSTEYIAVVGASGGTVRQLSHPAAHYYDFAPVWSPDGTRIAFNRDKNHGDASYDIWIMKYNGHSAAAWIHDTKFNGYPAWSPDSSKLAYEQTVSGHKQVFVRKVSGGTATRITHLPDNAVEPEWSPDGRWIIVGNGIGGLVKLHATGGAVTVVTTDGGAPSWQPLCNNIYSSGADHITGTSKAELLCGGGGKDVIDGAGGNDIVMGGSGRDTLKGGSGNDVLVGGADNDTFNGGSGKDTCVQGAGSGSKSSCEY